MFIAFSRLVFSFSLENPYHALDVPEHIKEG